MVKGDERLAQRMAVLRMARANPGLGASGISRLLAQGDPPRNVGESTIRYILRVYGDADISIASPPTKKGAGRKKCHSKRWEKYAFLCKYALSVSLTATLLPWPKGPTV